MRVANNRIQHFKVRDGGIAYTWSHGPVRQPLIMLHGLGDSAILTMQPRLTRGALSTTPVLFIDVPGFGEAFATSGYPATIDAYANDVAELLSSLRIENAPVFGHSMGGNIAIELAHTFPHFVARMIVAEPLLQAKQSVLAMSIAEYGEDVFVSRRFPMLVRATSLQAHRGDVGAAAFLQPLQKANPVSMYRAACSLITDGASRSESILLSLELPRTLLLGAHTITDPSALSTAGISIVRIADAGHHMLVEQAETTTYVILNTLC